MYVYIYIMYVYIMYVYIYIYIYYVYVYIYIYGSLNTGVLKSYFPTFCFFGAYRMAPLKASAVQGLHLGWSVLKRHWSKRDG